MAQALDKAGHPMTMAVEHHFSGTSYRATVAVVILQIGQLYGDLVPPFFWCEGEAAAGRGQAKLTDRAAVFAVAAGNSESYRISQSQLVVIALGDRGRDNDRRAVEYGEQFLSFADILAGGGLHSPQIAVDRRGQPGAAAGGKALLLGRKLSREGLLLSFQLVQGRIDLFDAHRQFTRPLERGGDIVVVVAQIGAFMGGGQFDHEGAQSLIRRERVLPRHLAPVQGTLVSRVRHVAAALESRTTS